MLAYTTSKTDLMKKQSQVEGTNAMTNSFFSHYQPALPTYETCKVSLKTTYNTGNQFYLFSKKIMTFD